MPSLRALGLGLIAGLLAWGASAQQRFSAPEPPPTDRARVFVVAGGIAPAIYVNGIGIGSLDAKEMMTFDVHPADYSFSWNSADPRVIVARTVEPLNVPLQGGAVLALSALLEGDIARMQIVVLTFDDQNGARRPTARPTSCPPSICL